MVDKRRASERVRGEPATKRKAVGRPPRSGSMSSSPAPRTAQLIEERLPSKIDENLPPPTLPRGTKLNASTISHLQSIAESGVLASSLQKSRNAWLNGGLFEKFYTKPTKKKKGENEALNNPPATCMTKIGFIKVVIEPHVFEAQLFSIRDWTTPTQPQTTMSAASLATPVRPSPPILSAPGVPSSTMSSFQTGPATTVSTGPNLSTPNTPASSVSATHTTAPTNTPTAPTSATTIHPSQNPAIPKTAQPGPSAPGTPSLGSSLPAQNNAQQSQLSQPSSSLPPPPPPPSSQDPVIQMLAQRASVDPELKALMKIVAAGAANPVQLEQFQKHINELNAIVARQRLGTTPMVAGNNFGSSNTGGSGRYTPGPTMASGATARPTGPGGTPIYQRTPSTFTTPQPPVKVPKAPKAPPAPLPAVIGLAIEFAGSNGDRYLFPKYSILEYVPDAKCIICSWLVVRPPGLPPRLTKEAGTAGPVVSPIAKVRSKGKEKGSIIDTKQEPFTTSAQTSNAGMVTDPTTTSTAIATTASDTKPLRETLHAVPESRLKSSYHQPVTMRLYTDRRTVFEMISSTASTADEARRFMEDIMTKTKRAEDVVLAVRLPAPDDKDKGDGSGADESGLGSPAPGTPLSAVAGRRASLLKPGLASPVTEVKRAKKMAKIEEYCDYCFSPVSRALVAAAVGGRIACESCMQLLAKNGILGQVRYIPRAMKRIEGPKALTL